jgi:hypothetical protein
VLLCISYHIHILGCNIEAFRLRELQLISYKFDGVTVDIVKKRDTRAALDADAIGIAFGSLLAGLSLFSESTPRLSYHITRDNLLHIQTSLMTVRFGNYRLVAYREFH